MRSHLLRDRRAASRTTSPGPAGSRVTPLWRQLERRLPDGFSPRHQWLWILPAGAVPAHDALEKLEERLFTVTDEDTHPNIQVIGAEQLHLSPEGAQADRLVDVGLYSARSGEVLSLTEPKELDQGQYDGRDAVPAVSAHGMLVHAPLFGDLGGFEPTLPSEYAAARFAQRAREVGAHIVIAPDARIRRADSPPYPDIHRLGGSLYLPGPQRRGQIRRRLAEANPFILPLLWLAMWGAVVLRTVVLTAVKAPDAAMGQLASSAAALLGWGAIGHTRRFARTGRRVVLARLRRDGRIDSEKEIVRAGRRADRGLRLSAAELSRHRRRLLTAETVVPPQTGFGLSGVRMDGEDDHDALLSVGSADGEFDQMPSRRSGDRLGLFLMLLALSGISLLVFRDLLSAEAVIGGAALPVGASTAEIFAGMTSLVSGEGLGQLSAADPFTLVVLALSALSGGHASTVVVWLTVLALPLAALTAWLASVVFSRRATVRVVAALLWAGVPTLHIALGEGRLGAVLVHVLLPLVVLATARAVLHPRPGGQRTGSWEHAAGAALLLAVLTAAAPVLLAPALIICVIGALVLGRRGRTLWLLPLPSLALAAPMLVSAALTGQNVVSVLASGPARAVASEAAPLWQQLLGFSRPFDPAAGLMGTGIHDFFGADFWSLRLALVIGAPLLLVGLLGIVTATRRSTAALASGAVLLLALGCSAVVSRLAVADDGVRLISADVAPLVSVIAFCLLAAAIGSLERLPRALPRLGGSITPIASTLLVFSVVASLGFWAVPRTMPGTQLSSEPLTAMTHTQTLLSPGAVRQVPATAADHGAGLAQLRTLVLDAGSDGVVGELVSGQGRTVDSTRAVVAAGGAPLWAQPSSIPDWFRGEAIEDAQRELSGGDQRLGQLIAALVTPGSGEVRPLMEDLGVGHVLISSDEDSPLVDAVDTAAGLTPVGPTDRGLLWRAETPENPELLTTGGTEGAPAAWARLIDAEGSTRALLPSENRQVQMRLEDLVDSEGAPLGADEDLVLQLATEQASGWRAELNGSELEPVGDDSWAQTFQLSAEQLRSGDAADGGGADEAADEARGLLTVEHSSVYQAPGFILVGAFLLLVALIAVPLPRGFRMLPVIRDAHLAEIDGRVLSGQDVSTTSGGESR